ncbi:hypothetical protein [Enterobacter bugandensis]|nr:hypothetical protein [Enterobacter bugandensis]
MNSDVLLARQTDNSWPYRGAAALLPEREIEHPTSVARGNAA